jgi:hypothetical protein
VCTLPSMEKHPVNACVLFEVKVFSPASLRPPAELSMCKDADLQLQAVGHFSSMEWV